MRKTKTAPTPNTLSERATLREHQRGEYARYYVGPLNSDSYNLRKALRDLRLNGPSIAPWVVVGSPPTRLSLLLRPLLRALSARAIISRLARGLRRWVSV